MQGPSEVEVPPEPQPKRRMTSHQRRQLKRTAQFALQNAGLSRYEARRQIHGPTRREATSHPTRRSLMARKAAENAARRRARDRARRAQVLSAQHVGHLVEVGA